MNGTTEKTIFNQRIESTWTLQREDSTTAHPSPRFGHTAVVYEESMIIFGGRNMRCTNDVWILHVPTMCWTRPDIPSQQPCSRAGHTAIVEDGMMYVFGGVKDGSQPQPWLDDLHKLDLKAMTWEVVAATTDRKPQPRKGHTAVSHNGRMIIFGGGQEDNLMFSDMWSFDYAQKVWQEITLTGPCLPCPRMYHVAVMANSPTMVVFGGRAANPCAFLNDLYLINLETNEVELLKTTGPQPAQRMCSTAIFSNHTLAVFTGGAYSYLSDSYQIDLRKRQWEPLKMPLGGRTRPTTVKRGDTMITFGGCVCENGYVAETLKMTMHPLTLRELCVTKLVETSEVVKSLETQCGLPEHLHSMLTLEMYRY